MHLCSLILGVRDILQVQSRVEIFYQEIVYLFNIKIDGNVFAADEILTIIHALRQTHVSLVSLSRVQKQRTSSCFSVSCFSVSCFSVSCFSVSYMFMLR